MKALFDFRCANGHTTEEYIDNTVNIIQCPVCKSIAEKTISCTGNLRMDGRPIHMLGDAWARAREKNYNRTRERDG